MAASDEQLQKKDKSKLMRDSKVDTLTKEWIDGDRMSGELIQKLIPMATDPHGQLGLFMMRFLFGTTPKLLIFRANRSNTEKMHQRITNAPCPSCIILQATANWKRDKTTRFFGGSYTAPTPQEYTMQQLGLTLTKAYKMFLGKATLHMEVKPLKIKVAVAAPPGFESIEAKDLHDVVDIRCSNHGVIHRVQQQSWTRVTFLFSYAVPLCLSWPSLSRVRPFGARIFP